MLTVTEGGAAGQTQRGRPKVRINVLEEAPLFLVR